MIVSSLIQFLVVLSSVLSKKRGALPETLLILHFPHLPLSFTLFAESAQVEDGYDSRSQKFILHRCRENSIQDICHLSFNFTLKLFIVGHLLGELEWIELRHVDGIHVSVFVRNRRVIAKSRRLLPFLSLKLVRILIKIHRKFFFGLTQYVNIQNRTFRLLEHRFVDIGPRITVQEFIVEWMDGDFSLLHLFIWLSCRNYVYFLVIDIDVDGLNRFVRFVRNDFVLFWLVALKAFV